MNFSKLFFATVAVAVASAEFEIEAFEAAFKDGDLVFSIKYKSDLEAPKQGSGKIKIKFDKNVDLPRSPTLGKQDLNNWDIRPSRESFYSTTFYFFSLDDENEWPEEIKFAGIDVSKFKSDIGKDITIKLLNPQSIAEAKVVVPETLVAAASLKADRKTVVAAEPLKADRKTEIPEYVFSKEETKECLSGALSLTECKAAQVDLGLEWTRELTNSKYPKGCYINKGKYVYFNKTKTGASSSARRNICQKESESSTEETRSTLA